jgi:hypothetical protein
VRLASRNLYRLPESRSQGWKAYHIQVFWLSAIPADTTAYRFGLLMFEPVVPSLSKHTRLSTGSRQTRVKTSQDRINNVKTFRIYLNRLRVFTTYLSDYKPNPVFRFSGKPLCNFGNAPVLKSIKLIIEIRY